MQAITLYQPFATLIAIGRKNIETRGWATSHRGPLAIHAGKTRDQVSLDRIRGQHPDLEPAFTNLLKGHVVAVVTLYDVVEMTEGWIAQQTQEERDFGFYEPGRCGWLLREIKPLRRPVPCRGWMKVWKLPPDVERKVRAQI